MQSAPFRPCSGAATLLRTSDAALTDADNRRLYRGVCPEGSAAMLPCVPPPYGDSIFLLHRTAPKCKLCFPCDGMGCGVPTRETVTPRKVRVKGEPTVFLY